MQCLSFPFSSFSFHKRVQVAIPRSPKGVTCHVKVGALRVRNWLSARDISSGCRNSPLIRCVQRCPRWSWGRIAIDATSMGLLMISPPSLMCRCCPMQLAAAEILPVCRFVLRVCIVLRFQQPTLPFTRLHRHAGGKTSVRHTGQLCFFWKWMVMHSSW